MLRQVFFLIEPCGRAEVDCAGGSDEHMTFRKGLRVI
jgi:hypothetical protein